MNITDELRTWADVTLHAGMSVKTIRDQMLNIADRIEAAHTVAVNTAYDDGVREGRADVADNDWLARNESEMAEYGWVRGPIGADGKTMTKEHMVVDDGGNVGVIIETRFNDSNWFVLVDFGKGRSDRFVWFMPKSLTHYHKPTVEDVLREFAQEMNENLGMYTSEAIDADEWRDADAKTVEKYAAKLRLTDDGKEQ